MQKHIENNCFEIKSQGKCFPCSPFTGDRECCPSILQQGSQNQVPASGHLLPYAASLRLVWRNRDGKKKRENCAQGDTEQPKAHVCLPSLSDTEDSLQGEIKSVPTSWSSSWPNVALFCTYRSSADQLTGQCTLWAGNVASTFSFFLFFPLCSTTIWVFQQHSSPCSLPSHLGRNAGRANTPDSADPEPWLTPTW